MSVDVTDRREDLPVYILAGGRSSRFGSDKARAVIGGRPLIQRLAAQLAEACDPVTVVAEHARKYEDLGLPGIRDEVPGQGPVGGLGTALAHRLATIGHPGWILLTACDWAYLEVSWIASLRRARTPRADAVMFHTDRRQPLLALYHSRILPLVKDQLRHHSHAMGALLDRLEVVQLTPPAAFSGDLQINTREAYHRCLMISS